MYDIIVVGAGPAGLTAAIYARRAEKSVLIIEKECFGGQITQSPRVENYPGSRSVSGAELGEMLLEHATDLGAEIELDRVIGIDGATNDITVRCEQSEHHARAVIISTGSSHRKLGLDGEERFTGEGISYCAVCDGAFYKNKTVAIIGGGNSALQEALLLSESSKKVYVVQNLPYLTGERSLQASIKRRDNIDVLLSTVAVKIISNDGSFCGLALRNTDSAEEYELRVDGVFVAIGQVPMLGDFKDIIELNEQGYAIADEDCIPKTHIDGVFVAGDCRTKAVRQVTTATADGAVAALAACRFVDSL